MHYYSVFKDQPFWGERKLYSLNPDRVNGYVRILRRNFHRLRHEAPPKNNLRILIVEVKPPTAGKSLPAISADACLIRQGIRTTQSLAILAASFGGLFRSG